MRQHIMLIPFYIAYFILTWIVSDNVFFWDTVQLASKHAHYFYYNGINNFILPEHIDSGHIPIFGFYISQVWKFLGRDLLVSHAAMLPFLLGIVYQSYLFLKDYIDQKYLIIALLIFLCDPTLLAQSILVSPDIPLIFFFLIGINAIKSQNRFLLMLSGIGLSMISMRGMMIFGSLGIFEVFNVLYRQMQPKLHSIFKLVIPYIPALLIIIAYMGYHKVNTGWIAYHENSPWSPSFERASLREMGRNAILLAWRLADFGRFIPIIIGVVLYVQNHRQLRNNRKLNQLFILLGTILLVLSYTFISYKYLSGHRYLLPVMLLMLVIILYIIELSHLSIRNKIVTYAIVLSSLIMGNFIVYPEGVAQGWDASLAHYPYYKLRANMGDEIVKLGIDYKDIGADFPDLNEQFYYDLSAQEHKFHKKVIGIDEYCIYSNIYNDYTDEEIAELKEAYTEIIKLKKGQVFMSLYKKNKR